MGYGTGLYGKGLYGVEAEAIFGGAPREESFFSYSHKRLKWSDTPLVAKPIAPPEIVGSIATAQFSAKTNAVGVLELSGSVDTVSTNPQAASAWAIYTPLSISGAVYNEGREAYTLANVEMRDTRKISRTLALAFLGLVE